MKSTVVAGMASLAAPAYRALGAETSPADKRPNVVFVIADDVSFDDLACYGHPTMKTPHLDSMAAAGMRFTNAYLTISSCSPSRCSIISGRYPHNTGACELHTSLPEGQVLFPKLLMDAGYYTVLSGKNHMGKYASTAFNKISGGKGPGREGDWVSILQDRPKDKPFFCWFASTDAHRNWAFDDTTHRYKPADVVVPPYLVDGEKTRQDLCGYYHEVTRIDYYIGQITAELKTQGVLDNTVIIFMADNGRPFPRCKTRLYDSGIKTPFIVRWPARVKPAVTPSFVSAIDVAATVLDVAGVKKDKRIQGVSFAPVLADPKASTRDVVFAEHNWHVYQNHERMVRTGDWLYIRNNVPGQANLCVEGIRWGAGEDLWNAHAAGKLTKHQQQVVQDAPPAEELYRVSKDGHQLTNVAANPEYAKTLNTMRKLLTQWTDQTGDTVPKDPTPDRDARPGKPKRKGRWSHREQPGKARNAQEITHPGPLRTGG